MEITKVKLKKINSKNSKLLAIASIQLDSQLIIHDLKLIQLDDNKRIVRFPNKKTELRTLNDDKNGYDLNSGFVDIVHPCTPDLRNYIEKTLFKLYDEEDNI